MLPNAQHTFTSACSMSIKTFPISITRQFCLWAESVNTSFSLLLMGYRAWKISTSFWIRNGKWNMSEKFQTDVWGNFSSFVLITNFTYRQRIYHAKIDNILSSLLINESKQSSWRQYSFPASIKLIEKSSFMPAAATH